MKTINVSKSLFLLFIMAIIGTLSSCTDDWDTYPHPGSNPTKATYTVTEKIYSDNPAMEETTIDITIFEYNEHNERIAYNDMKSCHYGETKTFTANKNAVKLKIAIKMTAHNGDEEASTSLWAATVFYLEQGGNIQITIDGNTRTSHYEP